MDAYDWLFVVTAFSIQLVLLAYFAFRKWSFARALCWGWIVYALAVPALLISLVLALAGKPWPYWLAGLLYTAYAAFGYTVDIARPVEWRAPVYLPVLIPYILLYLAAQMFYWFPLANLWRPLWFAYAVLFVTSTYLNISSHGRTLRRPA